MKRSCRPWAPISGGCVPEMKIIDTGESLFEETFRRISERGLVFDAQIRQTAKIFLLMPTVLALALVLALDALVQAESRLPYAMRRRGWHRALPNTGFLGEGGPGYTPAASESILR